MICFVERCDTYNPKPCSGAIALDPGIREILLQGSLQPDDGVDGGLVFLY